MLPPSLRTGAWRTHHHRVTTTAGLSSLDIAKTLQYCLLWLYVRAQIASSDLNARDVIWAFEILFEIPRSGTRKPKREKRKWAASKADPSSSPAPAAASAARPRCCSPRRAQN